MAVVVDVVVAAIAITLAAVDVDVVAVVVGGDGVVVLVGSFAGLFLLLISYCCFSFLMQCLRIKFLMIQAGCGH